MYKQKLTQRIYESLRADILAGKYEYGEHLPSIAKLCELHEAGRNTIRTVLAQLEQEGFLTQEKGKNARICFNLANQDNHELFLRQLCGKAPYMRDVFDTIELILPDISLHCIHRATPQQMQELKKLIQDLKHKDLSSDRLFLDALIEIYVYVLSMLGNQSMIDLFMALTQFVFIGVPTQVQNHAKLEKIETYAQKMISTVFEFVMLGKPVMMKKSLQVLLSAFGKSTNHLIKKYESKFPDAELIPFTWRQRRTRDYLYDSIASDVIRKIIAGAYQHMDSFLSIEQLAEEYKVSTRTSRKVLEVLNDYQIITTVNGIGSFVNLEKGNQVYTESYMQQLKGIIKEYCQAMELLKLCVLGIEKAFFKQMDDEQLNEKILDLELDSSINITSIVKSMFLQNSCLKTIYQELNHDLQWAFSIFNFYPLQDPERFIQSKGLMVQSLKEHHYKKSMQYINELLEMYYQHALRAEKLLQES